MGEKRFECSVAHVHAKWALGNHVGRLFVK